jgi:hypothetical protein
LIAQVFPPRLTLRMLGIHTTGPHFTAFSAIRAQFRQPASVVRPPPAAFEDQLPTLSNRKIDPSLNSEILLIMLIVIIIVIVVSHRRKALSLRGYFFAFEFLAVSSCGLAISFPLQDLGLKRRQLRRVNGNQQLASLPAANHQKALVRFRLRWRHDSK